MAVPEQPTPLAPESASSRKKRGVVVGAAFAAAAIAVGVSVFTSADSPSTDGSAGGGHASYDDTALAKFYTQDVNWGPCTGFEAGGNKISYGLQCARITVPVDYDDPDGDSAEIAISRARATGDRIGSVLMNPGGPGASGLRLAAYGYLTPLGERFDVVGFDPRGIGASTPSIQCFNDEERDADRQELDLDNSPAGIEEQEEETRDYIDKCFERSGEDFLEHVGTYEVVRDMDIIRGALGDEKLNYVGISYGTRIGATYAETFPTRVRAMVLDGAVNPAQDQRESSIKQWTGFQKAFDEYVADCVTKPTCPLGTDPAGAIQAYRALVDPLVEKSAATEDPRGLGFNDAQTGTIQALYSPELWDKLTDGLTELQQGKGDTLLELADSYMERREDGTYANQTDATTAIRCVDKPAETDRAKLGQLDTDVRKIAPFLDDGRGTGLAPLGTCAMWPVPPTSTPHEVHAEGAPNIVVVSTTQDPATPHQAGIDLANQLGGSLITYEGTQHGAFLSDISCVDDAALAYLFDLTTPAEGLVCEADAEEAK
ncbi:alpha/beta hydrolase [Antrihabitans sp. YC2-6]|uniref:alpha/beta hydrolase n=1 Tax=Antrihabitans sp. YC2-6 TaxID=2799498 RepID=UPI0018F4C010|nr:alpha/beta hydrolase [Antrihabitans sp. YC2-6]MBJ8343144.1 alpha/beta hydrolase [Antrihabitans sp. YC2-6]